MRFSYLSTLLLSLTSLASAGFFGGEFPELTEPTEFNGKAVPIQRDLNATTFDVEVPKGYWLVWFYSPYCSHCIGFAPTWKTVYEYYYTQEPVPQHADDNGGEDLNSFTQYYDFHFGKVDCIANADLCDAKNIHNFPTLRFYKKGEMTKEAAGARDIEFVSDGVEEVLESIRPGSRPQGGPKLPKVGDTTAEPVPANAPLGAAPPRATTEDSSEAAATGIPTVERPAPNHMGKSVPLTAETFQRVVTNTGDPWFIKFYAPWCPHCNAMAPNWQGMARQMQGRLNVGEVDCTVEKRLCKDVKANSYPTILFFRNEERIEYDGLRGLGDLIRYAKEAVSVCEGVKTVDAREFEEMEETEEVIFLYFFDHATTTEDFAALDRLPMSLIGHAKLVKTDDMELVERYQISTWPRLIVSRNGIAKTFQPLAPQDIRNKRAVLDWMRTVWLPLVPELTASNAHEIMDHKLVVLGILSRDRPEEMKTAKREIKNAAFEWIAREENSFRLALEDLRKAKQLRIEEAEDRHNDRALRTAKGIQIHPRDIPRPQVGFAWVDGVFWERWIKTTFGVSVAHSGERVVINDEDNKRYWDQTMTGNAIVPSRTSILETLPRIVASPPKIAPKRTMTVLGHLWWVIRTKIADHPLIFAALVIVTAGGLVLWRRRSAERYGYFKVGMNEKGGPGPMDGLLGNGANQQGKKD